MNEKLACELIGRLSYKDLAEKYRRELAEANVVFDGFKEMNTRIFSAIKHMLKTSINETAIEYVHGIRKEDWEIFIEAIERVEEHLNGR